MRKYNLFFKRAIAFVLMISLFAMNLPTKEVFAAEDSYIEIWTAKDLDNIRNKPNLKYRLMSDIDLSNYTSYYSTTANGWFPIGYGNYFTGAFDGNGHTISGLWSGYGWGISYKGLFSVITNGAVVENVNIELDKRGITGGYEIGGITGVATNGAVIRNCNVTNGKIDVIGGGFAGGVVGFTYGTPSVLIENCVVTNTLTKTNGNYSGGIIGVGGMGTKIIDCKAIDTTSEGYGYVGGIAGGLNGKSSILNCYSNGNVKAAASYAGGLVGVVYEGSSITSGYAEGDVKSSFYAGGLVGTLYDNSTITESYATGDVSTTYYIAGGLVGEAIASSIKNCYARGSVSGTTGVGGLVGYFSGSGLSNNKFVENCYSTGSVKGTGTTEYGAFNGRSGVVYKGTNFYDLETATVSKGYGTSGYPTGDKTAFPQGKTTEDMMKEETFTNWDFENIWAIDESYDYPVFKVNYKGDSYIEEDFEDPDGIMISKEIEDEFGNVYTLFGLEEDIDKISISQYKDEEIEDVVDSTLMKSVSKPDMLSINVDGELYYSVKFIKKFNGIPDRILKFDHEDDMLAFYPFTTDENNRTIFTIRDDIDFIPVKEIYQSEKYEKNAQASTIPETTKILKNQNGELKIQLEGFLKTYILGDNSDYKVSFEIQKDEKPIYSIENLKSVDVDYKFKNSDKSGIYTIVITMKPKDEKRIKIWKQDIYMQQGLDKDWEKKAETLALKYAPVIVFADDAEYFPMKLYGDENSLFNQIGKINKTYTKAETLEGARTVKYSDLDTYMAYNGNKDYLINLSNDVVSKDFENIKGNKAESSIYYSYMEDGDKFYINYHFIYGYDKKDSETNFASHNFDRESMTLEFKKGGDVPLNVIVGGHLDGHKLSLNGSNISWENVRVKIPYDQIKATNDSSPIIAIAKGSHAIYPVSGKYTVDVMSKKSTEQAGLDKRLSKNNNKLSITNKNILFPNHTIYKDETYKYTLLALNVGNLEKENPLNFSGAWVDIAGFDKAKFPPFTDREADVKKWVDNASKFDMTKIPENSRLIRQDINAYITQLYTVAIETPRQIKSSNARSSANAVFIEWDKNNNLAQNDKISYVIKKDKLVDNKVVFDKYITVKSNTYTDLDVSIGTKYQYTVNASYKYSDEFEISSKSSDTVSILVEEYKEPNVKGQVKDGVTLEGIENAEVIVGSKTYYTDSEGNFSIAIKVNENEDIYVQKEGYEDVVYYEVSAKPNEIIYLDVILQIPTEYSNIYGDVDAQIVNALNNLGLENATIKIRNGMNNSTGEVLLTKTSDQSGDFIVQNLKNGVYTGEVELDGFIKTYFNFICIGENTNRGIVPISPILSEDEIRVVLTWGENPRDLDSHLIGNGGHVAYYNKVISGAMLDVDDVTSFGPETVTIDTAKIERGVYRYYVHLYSGSGTIANSPTQVKVYSGDVLVATYNAPSSATTTIWNVFEFDTNSKQIKPLDGQSARNNSIMNDISIINDNMLNNPKDIENVDNQNLKKDTEILDEKINKETGGDISNIPEKVDTLDNNDLKDELPNETQSNTNEKIEDGIMIDVNIPNTSENIDILDNNDLEDELPN